MNGTLTLSAGKPFHFFTAHNSDCLTKPSRSPRRTAQIPSQYNYCKAAVQTLPAETRRKKASSLYEVLSVKETASLPEIKSAYRNLAKMHHPDASESDGRYFIEIHEAYSTLSDPTARSVYDLSLGTHRRRSRVYTTRRWETDQCW